MTNKVSDVIDCPQCKPSTNKEKEEVCCKWCRKQSECVVDLCPEVINNYYDKQYEEEMFQRYGIKYSEYEEYEEVFL